MSNNRRLWYWTINGYKIVYQSILSYLIVGDKLFNCHSPTTSVKEQTYRRARLWLAAMDIFSLDRLM